MVLWGCHSGQGVPHVDPLHAFFYLETHGYLLQNELTCLLLVGMCVLLLLLRRHAILRPGRGILLLWLLVLLGRRAKAVGGRRHAMLLWRPAEPNEEKDESRCCLCAVMDIM